MRMLPGTPTLLPPRLGVAELHRLPVLEEPGAGRRMGRVSRPSKVTGAAPARINEIAAAADARALRLDDIQREQGRKGRVRGAFRLRAASRPRRPLRADRRRCTIPWREPAWLPAGQGAQPRARRAAENQKRRPSGGRLLGPNRLGNVGAAVSLEATRQAASNPASDPALRRPSRCRAERGSPHDQLPRVTRILDPADTDQRDVPAARASESPERIRAPAT